VPRLKTIVVLNGTDGRGDEGNARLTLTGSARNDIGAAVEIEHGCSDGNCDIAAALENGYPFAAARLLHGATETPLLDRVFNHYQSSDVTMESVADWDSWVRWHKENGRQCDSCGSFQYDDSDVCGNCLAVIPKYREKGNHKCISEDWLLDNLPPHWDYDCVLGPVPGFVIFDSREADEQQSLFIPLDLLKLDRKENQ